MTARPDNHRHEPSPLDQIPEVGDPGGPATWLSLAATLRRPDLMPARPPFLLVMDDAAADRELSLLDHVTGCGAPILVSPHSADDASSLTNLWGGFTEGRRLVRVDLSADDWHTPDFLSSKIPVRLAGALDTARRFTAPTGEKVPMAGLTWVFTCAGLPPHPTPLMPHGMVPLLHESPLNIAALIEQEDPEVPRAHLDHLIGLALADPPARDSCRWAGCRTGSLRGRPSPARSWPPRRRTMDTEAEPTARSHRQGLYTKAAVVLTNFYDPLREPGKRHNGDFCEIDLAQGTEVVDAVLPLITEADQLKDLQSGSLLVVPLLSGAWAFEWAYGELRNLHECKVVDLRWLLERYGSLTVVFRAAG